MFETDLSFTAEVFLYKAEKAAWHFVTVPVEFSEQIKFFNTKPRGMGAVKVACCVGGTAWRTSVFPDKKSGSYFLPLKKDVRDAEGLLPGTTAIFRLTLSADDL